MQKKHTYKNYYYQQMLSKLNTKVISIFSQNDKQFMGDLSPNYAIIQLQMPSCVAVARRALDPFTLVRIQARQPCYYDARIKRSAKCPNIIILPIRSNSVIICGR